MSQIVNLYEAFKAERQPSCTVGASSRKYTKSPGSRLAEAHVQITVAIPVGIRRESFSWLLRYKDGVGCHVTSEAGQEVKMPDSARKAIWYAVDGKLGDPTWETAVREWAGGDE